MKILVVLLFLGIAVKNTQAAFQCRNGDELPSYFYNVACNGVKECADGSDESNTFAKCLCPNRNETLAIEKGFIGCRKECRMFTNERGFQCRGRKRCICDEECGYSCINRDAECPAPELIPGSVGYVVMNKHGEPLEEGESYVYTSFLKYKCDIGKELVGDLRWCTGRRVWSNNPVHCAELCKNRDWYTVRRNWITCGRECVSDTECGTGLRCTCDGICGRACSNVDVDCGPAPIITNTIMRESGRGIQRVAYYSCIDGYFINSGKAYKKCMSDGQWYGEDVTCERIECGDPYSSIQAANGEMVDNMQTNYFVNATTHFACRQGYSLYGSRHRTCKGNGQWSGVLPVCDDRGDALRCLDPGHPINGRRYGDNFEVGSIVTYECKRGFVLKGAQEQVCQSNYKWTEEETPFCKDLRYPSSSEEIMEAFGRFGAAVMSTSSKKRELKLGRAIHMDAKNGHEIYFLFDISDSIDEPALNTAKAFAITLIKRMKAYNGTVTYGVTAFSNSNETIIRPQDEKKTSEIIDKINQLKPTNGNTDTSKGLKAILDQISITKMKYPDRDRNLFIFTDGRNNVGDPPSREADKLKQLDKRLEIYTITSCEDCKNDIKMLDDLESLSTNGKTHFIFLQDTYKLHKMLDKVMDIDFDYSVCGERSGRIPQINENQKIISGRRPTETWPWQAEITYIDIPVKGGYTLKKIFEDNQIVGGGSLLNNKWVLTAAHLFKEALSELDEEASLEEHFLVTLGLFKTPGNKAKREFDNVQMFNPEKIICHPDYDFNRYPVSDKHDIALIKLGSKLELKKVFGVSDRMVNAISGELLFTPYVRPICLPCAGMNEAECRVEIQNILRENNNPEVIVTGFGHTTNTSDENKKTSDYLLETNLHIQSDEICTAGIADLNAESAAAGDDSYSYTRSLLCARNNKNRTADACQGDSGGPLVYKKTDTDGRDKPYKYYIQLGIVSFGPVACGALREDKNTIIPGMYTRVSSYLQWINQTIAQNPDDE